MAKGIETGGAKPRKGLRVIRGRRLSNLEAAVGQAQALGAQVRGYQEAEVSRQQTADQVREQAVRDAEAAAARAGLVSKLIPVVTPEGPLTQDGSRRTGEAQQALFSTIPTTAYTERAITDEDPDVQAELVAAEKERVERGRSRISLENRVVVVGAGDTIYTVQGDAGMHIDPQTGVLSLQTEKVFARASVARVEYLEHQVAGPDGRGEYSSQVVRVLGKGQDGEAVETLRAGFDPKDTSAIFADAVANAVSIELSRETVGGKEIIVAYVGGQRETAAEYLIKAALLNGKIVPEGETPSFIVVGGENTGLQFAGEVLSEPEPEVRIVTIEPELVETASSNGGKRRQSRGRRS